MEFIIVEGDQAGGGQPSLPQRCKVPCAQYTTANTAPKNTRSESQCPHACPSVPGL